MRLHAVVRGRVQGVGFRWFVREEARALDLAGWVMNRRDGTVEIEADGPAAAIDAFHAALRQGPDGARVEDVQLLPPSDARLEHPFTIMR
jgi:acylphosphatase